MCPHISGIDLVMAETTHTEAGRYTWKEPAMQASMDLRSTACLRTVAQAAHESHMDTRKLDVSPHYSSTCRACGMAEAIGDVDL